MYRAAFSLSRLRFYNFDNILIHVSMSRLLPLDITFNMNYENCVNERQPRTML
jgi:hypothetical protein